MKISGVYINEFFYEKSLYKVFVFLKFVWNGRFEPKKNFDFGLIMSFRANFGVVRDYRYILQNI
jgi:hypothetical protein